MVSGADTLESEHDTSSNSGHSGHMETEHENDNHANDDNDNNSQVNGNTSNGNLEAEHSTDHNMEIETSHRDNNSILSNPARFETLVRWDSTMTMTTFYNFIADLDEVYTCLVSN